MRATCGSVWLFRGKDGVMEARSARLAADIYTSNGHVGGDELACAEQSTSSPSSRLHVPVLLQSTQPLDWTSVWLYSIPTVLCFPVSMRPVRARSCTNRPYPFFRPDVVYGYGDQTWLQFITDCVTVTVSTVSFCVSVHVYICCVRFSFFSTELSDWLVRTSPKWPIFCVERKTFIHSISPDNMRQMTVCHRFH